MHKYTFALVMLLILGGTSTLFSQQRTYSPYSRYGLGELSQIGSAQGTGMGNTGIGLRSSNYLNSMNPASYSAMDSMSFFFEAGLSGFNQTLTEQENQKTFSNSNFDYFAIGFPISSRFFSSIGLKPYSSSGYNILKTKEDANSGTVNNYLLGTGNISDFYVGLSFKPLKNLSIGANFYYMFGNIRRLSYSTFLDDPSSSIFGKLSEIHVSQVRPEFGIQYTLVPSSSNTNKLILGAVVTPKLSLHGNYSNFIANNADVTSTGSFDLIGDTIKYTNHSLNSGDLEIPLTIGFGASYTIQDKFIFAADYSSAQWGNSNFPSAELEGAQLTNSSKLAGGVEYTPKERNSKNYLGRIRYRAGYTQSSSYINYQNEKIKQFGMSFGLGLPLKRSKTSINLNCEIGQRGTSNSNLLKENYTKISLNMTMHEYWFFKQKFD